MVVNLYELWAGRYFTYRGYALIQCYFYLIPLFLLVFIVSSIASCLLNTLNS